MISDSHSLCVRVGCTLSITVDVFDMLTLVSCGETTRAIASHDKTIMKGLSDLATAAF